MTYDVLVETRLYGNKGESENSAVTWTKCRTKENKKKRQKGKMCDDVLTHEWMNLW